jgi:hypothetical protein
MGDGPVPARQFTAQWLARFGESDGARANGLLAALNIPADRNFGTDKGAQGQMTKIVGFAAMSPAFQSA